jgi:hypothetical protein
MLSQRHGGTLLVLPDGSDWQSATTSKAYLPTLPVTAASDANSQNVEHMRKRHNLFEQVMQGNTGPELVYYWADDMIRSQLSLELEWLGHLTATDGITVILSDLTLLGFGIFFDTREDADKATRVIVINPYDDEGNREPKALSSIGGARHQSAAITCRRFPGATAVVASQDGTLSSMTWDTGGDVVIGFRHLELLLDV